ncbi:MAG: leucine-rich repeat domain-containing protein [Tannerellaceae bacterium]|jgi:Leucine-rich repeat (LRR) protein|nr:leucine-rich repeat domain-containing protein [Tannerellaceae bacterium]
MKTKSCKPSGRRLAALLAITLIALAPTATKAQTQPLYHPGDIAVINGMIDNNGLKWTKAPADGSALPDDWKKYDIYTYGGIKVKKAPAKLDYWHIYHVKWSDNATNKRIIELHLSGKKLSGVLDVSGLTHLMQLSCSFNRLTSLDISGLTDLTQLSCSFNRLTSLDVSGLTDLANLVCNDNSLASLDLSVHTKLVKLTCHKNSLKSLDVSGLTNLTYLACSHNILRSLDVSGLTNLEKLHCAANGLDSLDVSGLTNLSDLDCRWNYHMTSLNVSGLKKLERLDCFETCLTSLDLSGSPALSQFFGIAQGGGDWKTLVLVMYYNEASSKYEANIELNNPTGLAKGLTYSDGKLIADNDTVAKTDFSVETGLAGKKLSGHIRLEYKTLEQDRTCWAGVPSELANLIALPDYETLFLSLKDAGTTGATISNDTLYTKAEGTVIVTVTLTNNIPVKSSYTTDVTLKVENVYHPGDIAVINDLIDKNVLKWEKILEKGRSMPWWDVTWSETETNRRIVQLSIAYGLSYNGTLDVSKLTYLEVLYCSNNSFTSLNVSGLNNLTKLTCNNNQLTSLDVSGLNNLTKLTCNNNNHLTSLNVSGLNNLVELNCRDNQLTSLNVSGLSNLSKLNCGKNKLTSLYTSGLNNLDKLDCDYNQFTSLDVSGLKSLRYLHCNNNQLTSLNVSGLNNLAELDCSYNQFTSLDVSGLNNLTKLHCGNNQLTSLDVSGLKTLRYLSCQNNQLTSLDLTTLSQLKHCYGGHQTQHITLHRNRTTKQYEASIALNNPTDLAKGLSYSDGKLISKKKSIKSTSFVAQTGQDGKRLSGTLILTYAD